MVVKEYWSVFDIVIAFEKKHDVKLDKQMMIADRFHYVFGEYALKLSEIKMDLNNHVPKGKIFDWCQEQYDVQYEGIDPPQTYESWLRERKYI
jgi:hypothetical protein